MKNANEKDETEGVLGFIQKYRKQIFICAGVVLLALIGSLIGLSVRDASRRRAIDAVENLRVRYEEMELVIGVEFMLHELGVLLADIENFARRHSGYPGARAWTLLASVHSRREEWPEAERAWAEAARTGPRTHLAPRAWFNAAIAAEEQGRTEEAIEFYASSVAAPSGFPDASRAQFSIGRLREYLGDTAAAIEAYRAVISGWPHDTEWVSLARSRIITLETR